MWVKGYFLRNRVRREGGRHARLAVTWQRVWGRGPLETVVAVAAGGARRAVAARRAIST
jgi:hypothetical protein